MPRPFRPFRSRVSRLLASLLVGFALIVNGMGMAHAFPVPATPDCCGQMMAGHGHGKPCPAPDARCDEQCLMRCQANNVLPVVALLLAAVSASDPMLPMPGTRGMPFVDAGPGLRPPISA